MSVVPPRPCSDKLLMSADHPSGRSPSPLAYSHSAFAGGPSGRRVFLPLSKRPPAAAEKSGVRSELRDAVTITTFLKAKTVNDVLKATSDVLEIYRTNLVQRDVRSAAMTCNEDFQPTLQDILTAERGVIRDRFPARCLVIDFDNSARLDYEKSTPRDLIQSARIALYTARSACTGEVLTDLGCCFVSRMPQLSEKARTLYIGAHGKERYERYDDTKAMPHGVSPPDIEKMLEDQPPELEFRHRPEHDVESIYWFMLSALLRVRPMDIKGEPVASTTFVEAWGHLLSHRIPDADEGYTDVRHTFLIKEATHWPKLFLGDMKEICLLLWNISRQVCPEYALCGDGMQPDHLHEAVQRLILQYLVDHDDIPLDPHHLRPIPAKTW